MAKREYKTGSIENRGGVFRLRYRVDGKAHKKTLTRGTTMAEAKKELRGILSDADKGQHVEPTRLTVAAWIDQWIVAGAPGRKKEKVGQRTLERYEELLRLHVKATLGAKRLQKLRPAEIDDLYSGLEDDLAPMTLHHVHTVFGACLAAAERTGHLSVNPMSKLLHVPGKGESDHGIALDEGELATFVAAYRSSPGMYPVIALTAATGARRNEVLALRWSDLNVEKKELRIERALDRSAASKEFKLGFKAPKTARGLRTISLDDVTIAMLLREKEGYLQNQGRRVRSGPGELGADQAPGECAHVPGPGWLLHHAAHPPQFHKGVPAAGQAARQGQHSVRRHALP